MSSLNDHKERDVMTLVRSINEYLELDKRVSQAKSYAEEHPLLTLFWVVTLAMCCIPIICFCTFICATVFLTVAGFVLIEGTVVTIATVLLGGALMTAGLLALGFSCSMVVGYYAVAYSLDIIQGVSNKMQRRRERSIVSPQNKPQ